MRDRLIVGLDVTGRGEAEAIVEELGDAVSVYKIGYQLVFSGGLPLVGELARAGKSVFLDVKLLDIANTVEKGIEAVARLGAVMVTIHARGQAMRAAVKASAGTGLLVLGVTVLTSLDDEDVRTDGSAFGASALVERRAALAAEIGLGGLVASASEARRLRAIVGPDMALVTPGIRPAGSAAGDQKRVATPAEAIRDGASHVVVARPILDATDRRAAAKTILAEMAEAALPL